MAVASVRRPVPAGLVTAAGNLSSLGDPAEPALSPGRGGGPGPADGPRSPPRRGGGTGRLGAACAARRGAVPRLCRGPAAVPAFPKSVGQQYSVRKKPP